jgi:ABC-type transporter lipoprotein component MlaA
MPKVVADGLTFVTNNARDFRKLFARELIHAGLIIIVPQVTPSLQRELFSLVLSELDSVAALLNEAIEVTIEDGTAIISRFEIPQNSQ